MEAQLRKHSKEITSIDDGKQRDVNALQSKNAELSMPESFELDSNVKDEREAQLRKDSSQIISMDDGIQMDFNA
jgi:hypothetical protein